MADIATLGLTIDSRPVTDAARALDSLSSSARRTEQAVGGLERSTGAAATGSQRLEQEINRARAAADDLGMSAGRASGVIQRFFVGLAAGAITSAVAGLKSMASEVIALDDAAKRASMSVDRLYGLRYMGSVAGVDAAKIDQGTSGLAAALAEAARGEGQLQKLFEANNIQLRERSGLVMSTNTALERAADLIRDAANESDKITIAKMLGLTQEWIPLLERGGEAFRKAREEAERAAGTVDRDLIQKARDFDTAWNKAWADFGVWAKSSIMTAAQGLGGLIAIARDLPGAYARWLDSGSNRPLSDNVLRPGEGPMRASDRPSADLIAEMARQETLRANRNGANIPLTGGVTRIPASRSGGGAANDNESALDRQLRQIEERTRLIQQQSAAMGMSTYEAERHRSIQQALNADLRDGGEISKKFADAQALVAGSSSGLTPELEKQRQRILEVADAYAKAVQSARELRLSQDIAFERQTMFMPDSERNIASRLRSVYGEGWSEQMNGAIAQQMRFNAALREANDIAGDFGRTFVNDIMNGKSVTEALGNAVKNLGARLMQIALDRAINQLFGNLLGTFGSGLFGGAGAPLNLSSFMTASANGNVFAGGNVIPFARGGVVSGPTIFPMANGMGLMGEAGPEAVMPLKRNSRGQLGVVAQGAMPVVRGGNVTIINNGRPVDAKTEQDRDGNWTITREDVADQVEGVMAKKVGSRRGPMASAIGSSFGIQQNGALVG